MFSVLTYFLEPSKEANLSMSEVRKEWENEALLAIKKAGKWEECKFSKRCCIAVYGCL